MRLTSRLALILVSIALCAPGVAAQGLGGAAEREKERRAKRQAEGAGKSYGDGDLSTRPSSPAPAASASPRPSPSPSTAGGRLAVAVPDADAERAQEEKSWRARAKQAKDAAMHAKARVDVAEAAIADRLPRLKRDGHCVFTAIDEANDGIGNCEQIEASRLERARAGLPMFRIEAERAAQALRDFQAGALRAGVPYDWIR